jgi:hypothetical protein
MNNKYFYILDYPKLPKDLLDNYLSSEKILKRSNADRNTTLVTTQKNINVQSALTEQFQVTAKLIDWIAKNISSEFNEISYMTMSGPGDLIPHTDLTAHRRINYVIDSGGENSKLSVYQHRLIKNIDLPMGYRPDRLEDLDLVESLHIESEQWVQLETNILHGVNGLTRTRKIISLHFLT